MVQQILRSLGRAQLSQIAAQVEIPNREAIGKSPALYILSLAVDLFHSSNPNIL